MKLFTFLLELRELLTNRAAPIAPPASPGAGCTYTSSKGVFDVILPLATELAPQPPAIEIAFNLSCSYYLYKKFPNLISMVISKI